MRTAREAAGARAGVPSPASTTVLAHVDWAKLLKGGLRAESLSLTVAVDPGLGGGFQAAIGGLGEVP